MPPFMSYEPPNGHLDAERPRFPPLPPNRGILGPDGLPWSDPDNKRTRGPDTGFAVSPVILFSSVLGSGWRTYWHDRWDEAMRNGREQAIAMTRDAFLMGLMQERKLATTSLKWHIEVDDKRDPRQKAIADGLNTTVRATPRFRQLCNYLLEAVWYGRYGASLKWEWQQRRVPDLAGNGATAWRRCLTAAAHKPINGDKIGHHWDGTPYLLVHSTYAYDLPDADVGTTTVGGRALFLRGSWRQHYIIHSHQVLDADFFDAEQAERLHGVGVRDVVYWINWIRQEGLANILDWCERTGLGIRLWYYQGGNPASFQAVQKAARDQSDKVNLLIPRFGERPVEGVDYVSTDGSGADLLLRLQEHFEGVIERYIVGQSMSGGADTKDGLGGTGRADFASDTKRRITEFDAANLGETLTEDLVKPMAQWTYQEIPYAEHNARLVFDVDQRDPKEVLDAAKTFVDMGGTVIEDEVRAPIGFSSPREGDKILGGQPPAAPGGPGAAADAPGGLPVPPAPAAPQAAPQPAAPDPAKPAPPAPQPAAPVRARRRRYDASHDVTGEPRAANGKWTKGGGSSRPAKKSKLARLGRKVLNGAVKLEHGAKELVKKQFAKLPLAVRLPVAGAIKTYYATYLAAQKAVDGVAKERGFTDEQRNRLASVLTTADVILGAKVVPALVGATGVGALAAGASSFVPPASVAYLAFSTARNPAATYRAARTGVRTLLGKAGGVVSRHQRDRGAEFCTSAADRLEAASMPDYWVAAFVAALGEGCEREQALRVASRCCRRRQRQREMYGRGRTPQRYHRADLRRRIAAAAAETHRSPSDAQIAAENYRKGRVTVHGLPLTIETPRGAVRSGTGASGPWSVTMAHHYGYIRMTESEADGDHVDVFLGRHPESELVFVVDQVDPEGYFDEHKCLLGFRSLREARKGYLACYSPGWTGLGDITPLTLPAFKRWLRHGDTGKPIAAQKLRLGRRGDPDRYGYVKGMYHGPKPPGNPANWVQVESGPKGGKRWKKVAAASGSPAPAKPTDAAPPKAKKLTPTQQKKADAQAAVQRATAKLGSGQALSDGDKRDLAAALPQLTVAELKGLKAKLGVGTAARVKAQHVDAILAKLQPKQSEAWQKADQLAGDLRKRLAAGELVSPQVSQQELWLPIGDMQPDERDALAEQYGLPKGLGSYLLARQLSDKLHGEADEAETQRVAAEIAARPLDYMHVDPHHPMAKILAKDALTRGLMNQFLEKTKDAAPITEVFSRASKASDEAFRRYDAAKKERGPHDPDTQRLQDAYEAYQGREKRMRDKADAAAAAARAALLETFRSPIPSKVGGVYGRNADGGAFTPDPKQKASIADAEAFTRGLLGDAEVSVEYGYHAKRAWYHPGSNMLNVGEGGSPDLPDAGLSVRTVVHELGHAIENQKPGVSHAARAFVEYRCGKEKPTDMARFGMPGEMGRKDHFDRALSETKAHYVGKTYASGDTEVISMGIEALYRDPAGFLRKDPEFAHFVLAALRGKQAKGAKAKEDEGAKPVDLD